MGKDREGRRHTRGGRGKEAAGRLRIGRAENGKLLLSYSPWDSKICF